MNYQERLNKLLENFNPYTIIDTLDKVKSIKFVPVKQDKYDIGIKKPKMKTIKIYTVLLDDKKIWFVVDGKKAVIYTKKPDDKYKHLYRHGNNADYERLMKISREKNRRLIPNTEKLNTLLEGKNDVAIRKFIRTAINQMKKISNFKVVHSIKKDPHIANNKAYYAMYKGKIEKPKPLNINIILNNSSSNSPSYYQLNKNTIIINVSWMTQYIGRLKKDNITDAELMKKIIEHEKSTIIHELTHFFDDLRWGGNKDDKKGTGHLTPDNKKALVKYFNDPFEANAFFIQLTETFLGWLFKKSKTQYLDFGSDKNASYQQVAQYWGLFKYEFELFMSGEGFEKNTRTITLGFNNKEIRAYLKTKGKRQFEKRLIQLFNDIKSGKVKLRKR